MDIPFFKYCFGAKMMGPQTVMANGAVDLQRLLYLARLLADIWLCKVSGRKPNLDPPFSMSFRKLTTLKEQKKSRQGAPSPPYARDPDLAYDRTRNNLIEGLRVAKAASEISSVLGPLKAVCELGILLLETTKVSARRIPSLSTLVADVRERL